MNLRISLSVVFVGTLAYACGPRTRSDLPVEHSSVKQQGFALASMGGGGMTSNKSAEQTLKSGSAILTSTFDVQQKGDEVAFTFRVVNASAKNVEVNFSSGQSYDFVVVDSVGREVWRWADGRLFTQSMQNKLLARGKSIDVSETWSPAKPGKFTAIAILSSTNYYIEQKTPFEHK